MPDLLVPFLGVVTVLTVTPGPDMLLVVRNGMSAGSRAAWLTGLGCCLGISLHATAAVLGLSAILAASAAAYTVVKLAGAAYLGYLGIHLVISVLMVGAVSSEPDEEPAGAGPSGANIGASADAGCGGPSGSATGGTTGASTCRSIRSSAGGAGRGKPSGSAAFRQGLFTNLLNPKIALLFLTLLPQFVAAGEPRLRTTATLAMIFLAIAVLWWRTFSLAIVPISRLLRGGRTRRLLDAVAGSALLAIGVHVALGGDG